MKKYLFLLLLLPAIAKAQQPGAAFSNTDTLLKLLTATAQNIDTVEEYFFDYTENTYGLLYFRSGRIFNKNTRSAIALYTVNDSTVVCALYTLIAGKWEKTENAPVMHIYKFSPADFIPVFADYNFDGHNDLFINFYITMGIAEGFGYLLTYNPANNTMIVHPESIEIPNLAIDKKHKLIVSRTTDRPGTKRINTTYKWVNDSLKIIAVKEQTIKK